MTKEVLLRGTFLEQPTILAESAIYRPWWACSNTWVGLWADNGLLAIIQGTVDGIWRQRRPKA
jgi:hypothetical protein